MLFIKSLNIYMLGDFKFIVDDVDLAPNFKPSSKKLFLLQYLILNKGKPVTVDNLVDVLWEDSAEVDLANTLKTLVSRLRKDLTSFGIPDAIVTRNSAYMWSDLVPSYVDVFDFEKIAESLSSANSLTSSTKSSFEKALKLYVGDLLANSNMGNWISHKVIHYQNIYIKTVQTYSHLLAEAGNYDDVIRVCQAAIDICPFESSINLDLMNALIKKGNGSEAMSHYQNITTLHYDHLGVKPSDEIIGFYKTMLKRRGHDSEQNIEEIHTELTDYSNGSGAYVCEYPIFKEIYSLYMRSLKRLGSVMFLAIIGIGEVDETPEPPESMQQAMHRLLDLLQTNLRSGDTISRYSPTQYAALLPAISDHKVGNMVLSRLKSNFTTELINKKFNFYYHLIKLDGDQHI